MSYLKNLFAYDKRIGRKQYLIRVIVLSLMTMPLFIAVFVLQGFTKPYLLFALSIFGNLFIMPVIVSRLKDLNFPIKTGIAIVLSSPIYLTYEVSHMQATDALSFALEYAQVANNGFLTLFSTANMILNFVLVFIRGTKGPNKYGDDPVAEGNLSI